MLFFITIGSLITCIAFSLSIFATNVPMLMLLYGVLGGFGLGLIYLPAVVAVGYYFEKKSSWLVHVASLPFQPHPMGYTLEKLLRFP